MANLQLDKISKIYSRLRNLLLYGLFGMTAALVDYAVFFIIIYFQLGETEWLASVLGNICVIGSAFSTIVFIRIDGLLNLFLTLHKSYTSIHI